MTTATDAPTFSTARVVSTGATSIEGRRVRRRIRLAAAPALGRASGMSAAGCRTRRCGRCTGSSAALSTAPSSGSGSPSNPAQQADKPPLPHPDPKPPSPEEAARLVERAWSRDPDWGAFVWVKMTTGMRRGEICGLRWSHVDLDHAVLTIRRTVFIGDDGQLQEKDTKTHQQRRVVLDAETAAVLERAPGACSAARRRRSVNP